jgi:hypothetical protein
VAVVLEFLLSLNFLSLSGVLSFELLGFLNHAVDFLLRQTALLVVDGDVVFLIGRLIMRANVKNAIRVKFVRDLNLRKPRSSKLRTPLKLRKFRLSRNSRTTATRFWIPWITII